MKEKYITAEDKNGIWTVPISVIAKNRAEHYAKTDPDTTYQEEYEFVMEDTDEAIDWFRNNMDWDDLGEIFSFEPFPPQSAEPDDMCNMAWELADD